jgi:hypothetical protein
MERIGDEVQTQLSRFDGGGSMPRLVSAWPELVGGEVARNAWPARIARDGTLHVNTSSSVWAFELGQLGPKMLERLRAELGPAAPTGLRFAQGPLPEAPPAVSDERATERREPSEEARRLAATLAAEIDAEDLRKQVEKAVAEGLSRAPDGRSL